MDKKLSLLLSDIVYLGLDKDEINDGKSLSINEFLNVDSGRWEVKDEDGNTIKDKNGDIVINEAVIRINENKNNLLDDAEIIGVKYDEKTGLEAIAIKNGDEITIAYRGTEDTEEFIRTDINEIFTGNYDGQFDLAKDFYDEITSTYPESKINLTGHSLGGALAQHVALTTNPQNLGPVVTFSVPGLVAFPKITSESIGDIIPGSTFVIIDGQRVYLDGEGLELLKNYYENREIYDEIMESHFRTDDPVPIIGANIGKNYLYLDLALDPHGIQGFYSMLTETPILIKDSLQSLDDVKNLISDFILTLINIFHIIGIKYSTFASYSPRANYSFISAELTRFNGHSRRI